MCVFHTIQYTRLYRAMIGPVKIRNLIGRDPLLAGAGGYSKMRTVVHMFTRFLIKLSAKPWFTRPSGRGGGPGPDRLGRLALIGSSRCLLVFTGLEPGDPKSDRRFV